MKKAQARTIPLLITMVCLLAGCAAENQKREPVGFPVRVGIQGKEPLPVTLNSDANNSIFVKFAPSNVTLPVRLQPGPNDRLPVALVLDNGQVLPIKIKSDANSALPVILEIQPDKPLPVVLNMKEALPVRLEIKEALPVAINISPNILILAGIITTAIIIVCLLMCLLCKHKQV
jgi:hypothetical protein